MRLFLADSCLDQLIKLPKVVQQKVIEFQRKFRQDSTLASIHLEPITDFKDNALRTARINDGYRAVIGVIGNDNFSLVYVDQHDSAYRWAKNKKFVWNTHTQSCQLISLTEEMPLAEPTLPANSSLFDAITDEQILRIGVPKEMIPKVRTMAGLDDLDALESSLPSDAYENLFFLLDDVDIESIIKDLEDGFSKSSDMDEQLFSHNNRRHFIEITDDAELEKMIEGNMEKWQVFLHPSQRKLIEGHYNGSLKVSGSAGTGKTVAAIHRLVKLAGNPDSLILFTTYTKALRDNLDQIVRKLEVPANRYILNNIDRVLSDVVKKNNVLADGFQVLDYMGDDKSKALWKEVLDVNVSEFDENFLYNEYIDVIVYNNIQDVASYLKQSRVGRSKALSRKQRMDVWDLVEKYIALKNERKRVDRLQLFNMAANYLNENEIRPYTHVITDEFQDFSNPELRFIRSLVAEGPNDLFLVGDPYQKIYNGRKLNFAAAGINIRGRSRRLKVNYRTTEEIKRMAVAVVKGVKYDDFEDGVESIKGYVSLMHGAKPSYQMAKDKTKEAEMILEYIDDCMNNGILPEEICVTASMSKTMRDLQDMMHKKKRAFKVISGGSSTGDGHGVSFCTFHSIKGLEFKVVIAMGVNERTAPSTPTGDYPFVTMDKVEQREYLTSIRSSLYVAMTRAQQRVLITGVGNKSVLLSSDGDFDEGRQRML